MSSGNNSSSDKDFGWENSTSVDDFVIPQLPSRFLLIARIVFVCCGLTSNLIVLFVFAKCRRLRHPRHTCWIAVTVVAIFVHLLAVIEMLSAAYPTRPAYTFLVFFKGTPFAFFSLGYTIIAVERYVAVSFYLWHKDNVSNRIVVLSFILIGVIVLVCLVIANCTEKTSSYFMPGNGVASWKLLLLGITVMASSLIGIVLQVLIYSHVKQLYRTHPNLRRTNRHLLQVRYQHTNRAQPESTKEMATDSKCVVTTSSQQYKSTLKKSQASRLDLEAGFYYFVISLPVLISNGTVGMFLTFNYFCSQTKLANVCHGLMTILLYIRTIQLFITACNPLVYFALSSEFRSACRSRFAINRQTKT